MKTPWANVVLLILILVQAVTGHFGMVNGRISRAWILWAHGIGAYALLVLLYWKGGIILDAMRRKKCGRAAVLPLLVCLACCSLRFSLACFFGHIDFLSGGSLLFKSTISSSTISSFLRVPR